MEKIKIGCETYTWQMAGEQYKGHLDHIMDITSQAGFQGIEPETSFIGTLADPVLMKETLDQYNLELSVLCLVEDWVNPYETEAEKAQADKWINFLQHFPDTLLLLVQMPGKDRKNLEQRQQNLLKCVNKVATRASSKGIACSYHPNSPAGSVYRTEEDYKILLNGLDNKVIQYTPDLGHIAKGGMDPAQIIRQYKELVNCVHYKDMFSNGKWAPMGEGIIDFTTITKDLNEMDFNGWVIVEDECDKAITDPDSVTLDDGLFIEKVLNPLLN